MAVLPLNPFDNQEFIDAFSIRWVYNAETDCWIRFGLIKSVPLANSRRSGLLSGKLKNLIDMVHNKGGGFGLLARPLLRLRTEDNPDGVLFGNVKLLSDSLSIKCVFADGTEIKPGCKQVCFSETDEFPPGFDVNYSDVLLNTMCVEVPGGVGQLGRVGDKGQRGKDGTGDGPAGLKGDPGKDAVERFKLTGVKVVELDEVFDTAITKLEMDQAGGRLLVTKGKLNLPTGDDAIAEQLIVAQISRDIKFKDCFDYELVLSPCRPDDDFDDLDPTILYYPFGFDQDQIGQRTFQPVARHLSDLVNDMIGFYQKKLDEIAFEYDLQLDKFIKDKDSEARKALDVIGDRLAECEHITYLEYCLAPLQCAQQQVIEIPGSRPDCANVAEAVGCAGADCTVLGQQDLTADNAPVVSFKAPAPPTFGGGSGPNVRTVTICPDGCWIGRGSDPLSPAGGEAFVPPGGSVPPGWTVLPGPGGNVRPLPSGSGPRVTTQIICVDSQGNEAACGPNQGSGFSGPLEVYATQMKQALTSAFALYKKTQLGSGAGLEFPPGTYAFVYLGGGVKQDKLSTQQLLGQTSGLTEVSQDFFVGDRGGGGLLGPLVVFDPIPELIPKLTFSGAVASTETGLEIGFAPTTYKNLVPDNFFGSHAYDLAAETESSGSQLPFKRTDFERVINDAVIAEETKIQWRKFPPARADSFADVQSIQSAYLNGLLKDRMLFFTTTIPGFFFARVKTAYSILNPFGTLALPPIVSTPAGAVAQKVQISFVNGNKVDTTRLPSLNTRPVGTGSIRIQIIKVDCPPGTGPGAPQTTPSPSTPSAPASVQCNLLLEKRIPNTQKQLNNVVFSAVYTLNPPPGRFDDGTLKTVQISMSVEDIEKLKAIGLTWSGDGPAIAQDGNKNQFKISGTIKGLASGQVVNWILVITSRANAGTGDWKRDGTCTFAVQGV